MRAARGFSQHLQVLLRNCLFEPICHVTNTVCLILGVNNFLEPICPIILNFISCPCLGIVTGCSTRPGTAAGYSRVRVRVGFLHPGPYPYPQPGVGGSAHTFKLRAKSTQTTPDTSFGLYVGMFSFLFFLIFPN